MAGKTCVIREVVGGPPALQQQDLQPHNNNNNDNNNNSEVCRRRCAFKLYGKVNFVKKHNYKLWLNDGVY